MATVRVLAATHINWSKVQRRLVRAGYDVTADATAFRAARHGCWDAVDVTAAKAAGLSDAIIESAQALLGFQPKDGLACSFDGPVIRSDAWPTVIDVARAVAASVPLAVLDDGTGTTHLIHPDKGPIEPARHEAATGSPSTGELLRRFMGTRNRW